MPDELVSIVIPAYNPTSYLLDAIASAKAQTHASTEIILVNDGSRDPKSLAILEQASPLVSTYIEQPNRGLGAARNAGFQAARGEYVVPLDADDVLDRTYVSECLAALTNDAAFVYTDYQVFGARSYRQETGDYNFYRLLDRNYLTYAALMRKSAWGQTGGYDEAMPRQGYEDWELWLRLGARGLFGKHISKSLFRYRREGASMYDDAKTHHAELVAYIERRHPELYEYENRARIKARWSPAASIIADQAPMNQTILDIQVVSPGDTALAPAVLTGAPSVPEAAEVAALAAWSGGATGRAAAGQARNRLHRHLVNAELDSLRSWTRHPARSMARLIPLRVKERVNDVLGNLIARPVFDLSFYMQFQPNSLLTGDRLVSPLVYYPKPAQGRKRVALVTPHLGPGGAEAVLYEMAGALSSAQFEILLLATQSRDDRWTAKWRERVKHVYDLAQIVAPEKMIAAVCSIVSNWRCDYLVVQNSMYGYAALEHIKKMLPGIKTFDIVHALDERWDQIQATAEAAAFLDVRIAMSEAVRDRVANAVLIRNGVDLERFQPAPRHPGAIQTILFPARLDAVKRPLLVADIAGELARLRPRRDFRFVVAGDGPEKENFERRVSKLELGDVFEFRGQVSDLAPLYAECDVVILTSRSEGVPLVVLEALASARPVVASKVGSIPEVLDRNCGVLIQEASAERFAQAIHTLLEDDELRARMSEAGRRKMEAEHDILKTRDAFRRLFDQFSSASVASTSRSTAME